jgi:hypothetical protein
MRGQGPQARRDGALAGGTAQLPAPPRRPLVTSTVPPPQTDEQREFEQEKRSQVENSKLLSDLQKWVRTTRTSVACARIATSIDTASDSRTSREPAALRVHAPFFVRRFRRLHVRRSHHKILTTSLLGSPSMWVR